MTSEWQKARLIPTAGIGSAKEAEQRATSALLAVFGAVRDLSAELLNPLGAPRAGKADVECFTEVEFKVGNAKVRPDGVIRATYGKTIWTALVEVKTGTDQLKAEQLNSYWDVARSEGFDALISISNEIAPAPGVHPTTGLKVKSNSKVPVVHYSWTAILASAVTIKVHRGVGDPDQAWILGELIRYLEHPASGAMAFDDMGSEWPSVREAARDSALTHKTAGVTETAQRWDQLLRFTALTLGQEIGSDVRAVNARSNKDPIARNSQLVRQLCDRGHLEGTLRIPNTAGNVEVLADLRARRISASITVSAPEDKGARGRCTWLLNQLAEADDRLTIEAFARNARTPTTASLGDFRVDKDLLLGQDKRSTPTRFRISATKEMGVGRKRNRKSLGFIDSILELVNEFYGTVVQNITPWTPPAPKITRPTPKPEPDTGKIAAPLPPRPFLPLTEPSPGLLVSEMRR